MVLIERPQAVNMKYLEGGEKKKILASEIGHPGQTISVIYRSSSSMEDTRCGGGKMEEGTCKGISSSGAP